jgi:Cu(I)/Ag(I) efflux system membrane fusion protein
MAAKKRVQFTIRTNGRVAFDPELAVAVKEYLEVAKRDPALRKSAVTRLKLLGMGDEEIRNLGAGDYASLFLPGSSHTRWVYASLYEHEAPYIKPGFKATIRLNHEKMEYTGRVRSLSPVVDPVTRTVKARIETSADLRPDTFVTVFFNVDMGMALTIPRSALIDTGERQIVFIVKNGTDFFQKEVHAGDDAGNDVVILSGISEGDIIVSSAAFLVESESRLNGGVP